jgi:hypothetical protein
MQQLALNPKKLQISNLPNNTDFVDHSDYRTVCEHVVGVVVVEAQLEGLDSVVDKMIRRHRESIPLRAVVHEVRCRYDYVALAVHRVLRMVVREMVDSYFVVLLDRKELVGNIPSMGCVEEEVEEHCVVVVEMPTVYLVAQMRQSFSFGHIFSINNMPSRVVIIRPIPMQQR